MTVALRFNQPGSMYTLQTSDPDWFQMKSYTKLNEGDTAH